MGFLYSSDKLNNSHKLIIGTLYQENWKNHIFLISLAETRLELLPKQFSLESEGNI
jgi:hypothetical protein